jgi:hypothetical protein
LNTRFPREQNLASGKYNGSIILKQQHIIMVLKVTTFNCYLITSSPPFLLWDRKMVSGLGGEENVIDRERR